jgi:hypothetical protein
MMIKIFVESGAVEIDFRLRERNQRDGILELDFIQGIEC